MHVRVTHGVGPGPVPRRLFPVVLVQVVDERHSHWWVKAPAGGTGGSGDSADSAGSVEWDAEIVDERPGEWLSWRSLPGADVRTGGMVRFAPAPGGRGTEVRVQLQYDPPGGQAGAAIATGEFPSFEDELARLRAVDPQAARLELVRPLYSRVAAGGAHGIGRAAARQAILRRTADYDARFGAATQELIPQVLDAPDRVLARFAQLMADYWDAAFRQEWERIEPLLAPSLAAYLRPERA